MTGPEHYAEAERLLAVADRHTSGVTYGPEWTLTLTAAHVHATLALAAATAVGTAGPDRTRGPTSPPPSLAAASPSPRAAVLRSPDPNSGALRRSSRQRTGRAIRAYSDSLMHSQLSLLSQWYQRPALPNRDDVTL